MWTCSICHHKFDKSDMDMDERTCYGCLNRDRNKGCACIKKNTVKIKSLSQSKITEKIKESK